MLNLCIYQVPFSLYNRDFLEFYLERKIPQMMCYASLFCLWDSNFLPQSPKNTNLLFILFMGHYGIWENWYLGESKDSTINLLIFRQVEDGIKWFTTVSTSDFLAIYFLANYWNKRMESARKLHIFLIECIVSWHYNHESW
jgi:hypothetical protein